MTEDRPPGLGFQCHRHRESDPTPRPAFSAAPLNPTVFLAHWSKMGNTSLQPSCLSRQGASSNGGLEGGRWGGSIAGWIGWNRQWQEV